MFVDAIGAGMQAASGPTAYINQVMQPVTDFTRASMAHGRVPYVIPGLRQAVVALRNVAWWSEATRPGHAAAAARSRFRCPRRTSAGAGGRSTPPARCSATRASRSSRPGSAGSADEAVKAAADLGGPLTVKIVSADIPHKSDIGGVRLDVPPDEDAVRAAYRAVTEAAARTGTGARVEGVLISPMRRGGTELLVGVVRDPQWGPVLAVAIGGLFVEVLQDSGLAPLPVTPGQAGRCWTGCAAGRCSTASAAARPPTARP